MSKVFLSLSWLLCILVVVLALSAVSVATIPVAVSGLILVIFLYLSRLAPITHSILMCDCQETEVGILWCAAQAQVTC